jgi:thioredoxin 1
MSHSYSSHWPQNRRRQLHFAALVFVVALAWLPNSATSADIEPTAYRFAVELRDGTKVIGELLDLDALPLNVEFGAVKIPLRLIHNVRNGQDDSPVKVRFFNGDLLSGRLGFETLVLVTEYGRLSITADQIECMTAVRATLAPTKQVATKAGILHCDDTTWSDKTTRSSTVTVVAAWAPWCAVCSKTVPVLSKVAGDYRGKVQFVLLNVDRASKTTKKLGIKAVPTMLVYRDGKLLDTRTGGIADEGELRRWLDTIYKKHHNKPDDNPFG